ncbi:MAG: DotD/TraH family lipoprotein [Alphaproteobacteria bacterium]|nr:DotD/TraH family lipoprotein [Alphaproteobacteria bacterium]
MEKFLMSKTISFFSAVGVSLLLAGCAVHPRVDEQLVASPDPLGLRMAAAVDKASAALQTLASVEQARNPALSIQAVPYAPQELRRTMTVDWVGPIEPIMRRLADRAGYDLQVNGDTPPAPVVVTLNAKQKMVIDVLRDLGLQAGQRADVVVDPDHRLVELNYAPISGD